jgi:hypothetical protein
VSWAIQSASLRGILGLLSPGRVAKTVFLWLGPLLILAGAMASAPGAPLPAEGDLCDYVYSIGGRDRGKTLGYVERFCVQTQTWETCEHMLVQRGSHGCAALNGRVYAMAGGGVDSNLVSAEYFNPITRKWSYTAQMGTERHALAASATDRNIYAVGGWCYGKVGSRATERYDPETDTWTRCADVKNPSTPFLTFMPVSAPLQMSVDAQIRCAAHLRAPTPWDGSRGGRLPVRVRWRK